MRPRQCDANAVRSGCPPGSYAVNTCTCNAGFYGSGTFCAPCLDKCDAKRRRLGLPGWNNRVEHMRMQRRRLLRRIHPAELCIELDDCILPTASLREVNIFITDEERKRKINNLELRSALPVSKAV